VSNGKGKSRKKPRSGGSRPATRSTTPAKTSRSSTTGSSGGLLGRVLGPAVPPSMSEMPTFRRSLGQGLLLIASNPVLLFAPLVWVFLVWVV